MVDRFGCAIISWKGQLMEHVARRGLPLLVTIGAVLVTSCGSGSSTLPTTTAAPEVAEFNAVVKGAEVNGDPVPQGASRQVSSGGQIVLDEGGRGVLRVGEVAIELFRIGELTLEGEGPPEVQASLAKGLAHASVAEQTAARLRLTTAIGAILTTLQPGTDMTVCQGPDVTCVCVKKGEIQWEQEGETKTYVAPQCSFGHSGETPHEAKCLAPGQFDTWFEEALGTAPDLADLGALVNDATTCDGATDASTTSSSTSSSTTLPTDSTAPTVPPTLTVPSPSTTASSPRPTRPTTPRTTTTPPTPPTTTATTAATTSTSTTSTTLAPPTTAPATTTLAPPTTTPTTTTLAPPTT